MLTGLLLASLLGTSPGVRLAEPFDARSARLTVSWDERGFEERRPEQPRPSLVAPIVYLSVGVGVALGGVILAYVGAALAFVSTAGSGAALIAGIVLLAVGAALIISGVTFAIIGGIKLAHAIRDRTNQQIDEAHQRLDRSDERPREFEPGGVGPQASLGLRAPQLLVATF